ncbi:MAG: 16S rRNA (guanine(527)-N(7))-methyltransferase RsmG [Nitrospirae bacterium]|nr:MAG: 16S rRNA (guanine(527)-N(7))-methyltransferase RsmG [Nitrospirota bacterium]
MFHVEQSEQFAEFFIGGLAQLGFSLTDAQVHDFIYYYNELVAWNKKINLTSITRDKEIAVKHFLDSLAYSRVLAPFPNHNESLLDVGSGAGFPGLPLKISHPDLDLTLLEPNLKKGAFLRHIIGKLRLKKTVVLAKRLQDLREEPTHQGHYRHIVTRAIGIEQILPFARPLLAEKGFIVLGRSKPLENRMDSYGLRIAREVSFSLPYGYGKRVLTVVEAWDN